MLLKQFQENGSYMVLVVDTVFSAPWYMAAPLQIIKMPGNSIHVPHRDVDWCFFVKYGIIF